MRKTLADKARLVPAIVLVGILVFSSLSSLLPSQGWTVVSPISTASADSTQLDLRTQVLDPAVNYLYFNYNPDRGLNYESPDNQSTYWVYSDNYLVSYILGIYDPDNTNWTGRAVNITNKMKDYLDSNSSITDHINQYMVLTESEPINESVSYFHGSLPEGTEVKKGDDYVIKTHINNLTDIHPTAENYSDTAFLQAIYYSKLGYGYESEALKAYDDGVSCSVNLTNGTDFNGLGFKDKAFNDTYRDYGREEYQTYKLALYIYASRMLRQDYDQRAFDTLLAMRQPDGGFKTGYDSSLNAQNHSTNMETTSLAVLALNFEEADDGVDSLLAIAAIVVIALAVIVVVAYFLIRKKSAIPPQAPITPPET